jgi:acylphosphatase
VADSAKEHERRLHAIVHGLVQGVGYRYTAIEEARRLGLAGWVRNRLDGTVEALAEGDDAKLALFLDYLKRGPWGARVTRVVENWTPAEGAPMPFQYKRTE